MVDTVGTASWEVRGRVAGPAYRFASTGFFGVSFRDFHARCFWIFLENRANSLKGQSDSDGALSSFSLFTFRYPSNDGVLRMVDSQGDYLIISKCNEELSPHHHSEAVRIGFLRIKRTVIFGGQANFRAS